MGFVVDEREAVFVPYLSQLPTQLQLAGSCEDCWAATALLNTVYIGGFKSRATWRTVHQTVEESK